MSPSEVSFTRTVRYPFSPAKVNLTRTFENWSASQLINCIAKRKSKKAAARAAAAGGAVGDNPGTLTYECFNGSDNTEFTPPAGGLANGIGRSVSSSRLKFLGARQRAGEKCAADDIGGGGRDDGLARGARSLSPRRAVVGTALPVGGGGTALRGAVNRGAGRGRGEMPPTDNPLWGRRAGADEQRSDVTPGRMRQERREDGGAKHPKPASGTIPEDWIAEEVGSGVTPGSGGRAAGGAAGGGGGTALASAFSSHAGRKSPGTSGGDTSPVGVSSVDVAIEEAIALSAAAAARALDDESSVASANTRYGFRDSREAGGVWMGGVSTVGSARYGDRYVGSDDVSSVGSQDSELPPSMAGLRLDSRKIREMSVEDTGLPSYEEAVAVVPYDWRVN